MIDFNSTQRIGIFRALQLGDMLCSIPALRSLRAAFPNAEVTLIGLPWAQSFARRFGKYFDDFISFPGYPGLPEQEFSQEAYAGFFRDIRNSDFDLLIQMQGNGTIVNEMMGTWNARNLAGFHNNQSAMKSGLFLEYPSHIHEIHRHLLLMEHLGVPHAGDELEFILTPDDINNFKLLEIQQPYVCIHPGSRGRWRQWPPELFARIADEFAEAGFNIAVTGTTSEADITGTVIDNMKHDAIDLTGMTTLGSMALLLQNSEMLVSNCTGVSHLAVAMRTPSVVISMDGEPERWAPLNARRHVTIDCRNQNRFHEVLNVVRRQLKGITGKKQENVEPSCGLLSTETKPL
ncbi:MAG TPA: glycosyltransferase family 9 protein [Cyclobacteriaceae bacterium]